MSTLSEGVSSVSPLNHFQLGVSLNSWPLNVALDLGFTCWSRRGFTSQSLMISVDGELAPLRFQVAAILHPSGNGGGGRDLTLEHGRRADGLGLLQHDVLNLLDELQGHGFELESSEGILWWRRAFPTGPQAAAPATVTRRWGLSRCYAT
ncbi:hypothetical protein EYF80_020178 [Liparis tanakae]|uniref:Uncharacterized protein n=1 Tax=Liparis tanakae TaxID=230148 RepID=A0A4Z2HX90_9TELE|nr:hypothetical protein EYF80_020178 [Liparis tanakae]